MTTGVFEVDGLSIASHPIFKSDCDFPIANWNDCCSYTDDVLEQLPIRIGWWSNDARLPVIYDGKTVIEPGCEEPASDCASPNCRIGKAPIIYAEGKNCYLKAPKMKIVQAKTPQWNIFERIDEFCTYKKISGNQWCVFDSNGNIVPGNPLSIDFLRFNMVSTHRGLISEIFKAFIHGDSAKANPIFVQDGYEIDGLYTQLLTGWDEATGEPACPTRFNSATTIDWAMLTGSTGCASADAKTIAGKSVYGCPVPAGLNLAEFFEYILIDRIVREAKCKGTIDQWEMHVGEGQGRCLVKTAACMSPCGTCANLLGDTALRDRFSSAWNNQVVELYPSGRKLPIMESRQLNGKNEIWFGPRSVGGRPSYVAFFDDMRRYYGSLDTLPGAHGYGVAQGGDLGYNPGNLLLIDSVATRKAGNLEDRAIRWSLKAVDDICLQGTLTSRVGVLACNRQLWFRFTNVCCDYGCAPDCANA